MSWNLVARLVAHVARSKFPQFTTQIRNRIFLLRTFPMAQENIISAHQSEENRRWHQAPSQIKAVLIGKLDFQPVSGWAADGFFGLYKVRDVLLLWWEAVGFVQAQPGFLGEKPSLFLILNLYFPIFHISLLELIESYSSLLMSFSRESQSRLTLAVSDKLL